MTNRQLETEILVIGASGLLGSSLMKYPISNKQTGTFYKNKKPSLIYLDVRNYSLIKETINNVSPDVILYATGITNVDECEVHKTAAYNINYQAVKYICSNFTNIKFVYYSSDYVFDGINPPYNEEHMTRPLNTYGLSKQKGEECVLRSSSHNLVIRVSGLYGFINKSSANKLILAEDNRFSRPINILDVIRGTQFLLSEKKHGIYHLAGNSTLSRYEYYQLLNLAHEKRQLKIQPVLSQEKGYKAPRPKDTSLSISKVNSTLFQLNKNGMCKSNLIPRNITVSKLTIFVDCIGGVLAERSWVASDFALNEIDRLCGTIDSSNESLILKKCEDNNVHINDITDLYTINPFLWPYLLKWRKKYRMILINNGWSQTFRIWVNKYCFCELYDYVFNSHEYGARKENPLFFKSIADKIKLDLNNCIIIDDDLDVINTCKKLGMKTIRTIKKRLYPVNSYVAMNQELIDEI